MRAPARVCVSYRGVIGYLLKCQRSCETQFVHDIISNLDGDVSRGHKQTDLIIMDFTKAFDKVPHSSNGQWHAHIENITIAATKKLGIMRKLKFTFLLFQQKCIKSNIPLPFTTNIRICIHSLGWMHSTRF